MQLPAEPHAFNGTYSGPELDHIAFPLGGLGAGMVCLDGTGALSHVSLRHKPEVFHRPGVFAALHTAGSPTARVLEGPVPKHLVFGSPGTGNGGHGRTFGLPRFREASFTARFPFATVALEDADTPLRAEITGWSPFVPGNVQSADLPVAALEYRFTNPTASPVRAVFSFHADNFMRKDAKSGARVEPCAGGFRLLQPAVEDDPAAEGGFAAFLAEGDPAVDCARFRGGWFDTLTMIWRDIAGGRAVSAPPHAEGDPSPGAGLYLPFELQPGGERTVRLLLCWYVPRSSLRIGPEAPAETACGCGETACTSAYEPAYAARFADLAAVETYWRASVSALRRASAAFRDCFYDTTLPAEAVEAVAANLTILKSPTCLLQKDGRFWGWEGCCDGNGCCHGSCTHVWNYAQALCHLFPELERTMRETEFLVSQDDRGHQNFRAALPIRPTDHGFHAAADGQLGGILKVFREWRISGDTDWLGRLWPRVRESLDYCIRTWDPRETGALEEPHHNTYDIEFWGPDGMCGSFYVAALTAAAGMGEALGEDVTRYRELARRGRDFLETELYNGEYFIQKIRWQGLTAPDPTEIRVGIHMNYSPEARELLQREGPKYQYGNGCLSDGVLGAWLALMCGVDDVLDEAKVRSHVTAVHRHNLKRDLSNHANPQRPTYAVGNEGGLLLCTWPRGGALSLPFVYSDEVWTGIEYQVAGHLIAAGEVEKGLEIVRVCRERYDGTVRNPFNEYECGHWYARALSSYGLLASLSGAAYDARSRTLRLKPAVRGDFRAFLATASGYGTVGVRNGKPFLDVASGEIPVDAIEYSPRV